MLQYSLETYILGQIFETLEVICKYWCYLNLRLLLFWYHGNINGICYEHITCGPLSHIWSETFMC
jgi:hypothetical protein